MRYLPHLLLSLAVGGWLAAPLSAQSVRTQDDGQLVRMHAGASGPQAQTPGSLTTLFTSNNGFAGNMFDITPSVDLTITGVDINVTMLGTTATVDVWYKLGTSHGFESNAAAWTYIGSYAGTSVGADLPTFMNMLGNGVVFQAGMTYGIYIDLTSYGVNTLKYTNGPTGGSTYANADLSLLTNAGKGSGFAGGTFQVRDWNGTIYYDTLLGGPVLSKTGSCPGQTAFFITGATPMGTVAVAYGPGGSFTIPSTSCAGVVLAISNPTLGGMIVADASGIATLSVNIPGAACGLTVQAVDMTSCLASNPIVL